MEKIIDITERVPTMKKKRKRRTNMKFTLLVTLFVAVILLLLYFQSSASKISNIQIEGESLLTEAQYLDAMNIQVGQSFWSFTKKDIKASLNELDWVKEVKVERKWPNKLSISITEWRKVAYISEQQVFYPLLENGFVYEQSDELQLVDAPIFVNFKDEKTRKKILRQLADLKPEVLALISQISAIPTEADPYAIQLFMNDGYEVRAEIATLAEKLNYYPSIISLIEVQEEGSKGIIDIEVGSYFRTFEKEYGNLSGEEGKGEELVEDE